MAQFPKGVPSNIGGRPKGLTAAVSASNRLRKIAPKIINNLLDAAESGDVQASVALLPMLMHEESKHEAA